MTATPLAPVTTAPAIWPGAQPMAPEQVDAHLTRIEHLLAELETATTSMVAASWGTAGEPETARFLPDDSRRPLVEWLGRISDRLSTVAELSDVDVTTPIAS